MPGFQPSPHKEEAKAALKEEMIWGGHGDTMNRDSSRDTARTQRAPVLEPNLLSRFGEDEAE
jgi:hypothetical protein